METIEQIKDFIIIHLDMCIQVGLHESIKFNILGILQENQYNRLLNEIIKNNFNAEESKYFLIKFKFFYKFKFCAAFSVLKLLFDLICLSSNFFIFWF